MRRVNAPQVQIGSCVRVIKGIDETFDERFLQKIGIVENFDFTCGCGQSYPNDPMIGVRFPNGKYEEFWTEELTIVK